MKIQAIYNSYKVFAHDQLCMGPGEEETMDKKGDEEEKKRKKSSTASAANPPKKQGETMKSLWWQSPVSN